MANSRSAAGSALASFCGGKLASGMIRVWLCFAKRGARARGFEAFLGKRDVLAAGSAADEGEGHGVVSVLVIYGERIDDIALGFGHLLTFGIPHQAVQVDDAEGHVAGHLYAEHGHARD